MRRNEGENETRIKKENRFHWFYLMFPRDVIIYGAALYT